MWILLIIIGILSVAFCCTFFRILLLKKDIRKIEKECAYIRNIDSNRILRTASKDQDVRNLANEINKVLEARIDLKQQIRHHEAEIRNVIANLSHDLRTPVTSMVGYTQLLQKESLTEKQKEYVGIVASKAVLLRGLVEQLYSYSVVMKEEDLVLKSENITSILEESVLLYYYDFEKKGIQMHLQLENAPVFCEVDKTSLMRVFMNLVSNALKYGEKEMYIEQKGAEVTFRNYTKEIDTIDTAKIFDRFFTVAKNRVNGSMGLGLAIAKELTLKMNGTIEAKKQNGYLVMKVTFPVCKNRNEKLRQ